ncbi:MAG TPA: type II 3-dehydroquinate dehydratase [Bacteroidota bacterium]|nr:type II 3-dehydroquinate dehydratase [Bacteroidota bacterium]
MRLLVINGPNLNLLGQREPHIYGFQTLSDIEDELRAAFPDISFKFFQSNYEGAIIDAIQSSMDGRYDGIIMNPGAFTHYSYAIRDAVAAVPVPAVEVHLSNIHLREAFRRNSVIAPVCKAQLSGFGSTGYRLAVTTLVHFCTHST